jgi:type IV pilus assembly protein PilA
MKPHQQGFTLIELMIVVAIIGILAAIALPAYADYTKRAHVAEGLTLAMAAKTGVTEFWAVNGRYPEGPYYNASIGLPPHPSIRGNAVYGVGLQPDGVIIIWYNEKVAQDRKHLILTPSATSGSVLWKCGGTLSKPQVGGAPIGTPVPPKWLPSSCRT